MSPYVILDYVRVTESGFSIRGGLWFDRLVHDGEFADLTEIDVFIKEFRTRRRTKSVTVKLRHRNGTDRDIPFAGTMLLAAQDIFMKAKATGLPVVDKRRSTAHGDATVVDNRRSDNAAKSRAKHDPFEDSIMGEMLAMDTSSRLEALESLSERHDANREYKLALANENTSARRNTK